MRCPVLVLLAALLAGCGGPGAIAPGLRPASEYAEHAAARELPAGLAAVAAPPFVVIGEGSVADVRTTADSIVVPLVADLRALYFTADPDPIQEVWLFETEESYRRGVNVAFGHYARTPYGYYAPSSDALFVNLGLGTGTVGHELVHVFMAANFPGAPTWFDEGLASLYEHSERTPAGLRGRPNWRLGTLDRAFEVGTTLSLRELTAASRGDFYDERRSDLHYAASRYVLYHLQQRGLLATFYRRFHAGTDDDATGYASLSRVLAVADLDAWWSGPFRRWLASDPELERHRVARR